MRRLLGAPAEVDRLKGKRPASVELLEDRQDSRRERQRLHVLVDPPRVLHAVGVVNDAVLLTMRPPVELFAVGHDPIEQLGVHAKIDLEVAVSLELLSRPRFERLAQLILHCITIRATLPSA